MGKKDEWMKQFLDKTFKDEVKTSVLTEVSGVSGETSIVELKIWPPQLRENQGSEI